MQATHENKRKVTLPIKPSPFRYNLLSVLSLQAKWTATLEKRYREEAARLQCQLHTRGHGSKTHLTEMNS